VEYLLVVTIVESCVGDSHVGLAVVAVAVLTVALEQGQCSNKVSLLQEVSGIRQLHFLLKSSKIESIQSGQ